MTHRIEASQTGGTPDARSFRPTSHGALGVLVLACLLLTGGCGNVTSGGFGDVEVVLSSDEVEGFQEAATGMLLAEAGLPPATSHGSTIQGTLTVRVRSFARRGFGDFVELTDGVQEVTVSLGDPEPIEIARRPMPAGSYDAVRTFFGRIEANVTGGLVIDGVPVTGTVRVDLGTDGALSVVTPTGFEVWENAPTVVAIEMQSGIWLRLVDAALRRVDLDDFRRIFRVRVRQRILSGG